MRKLLSKLWADDGGFIISVEMLFICVILVIGLIGGLAAGAFLGAALAAPRPYYAYAYEPIYEPVYFGPECYVRRERIWDGWAWRIRRVEECY